MIYFMLIIFPPVGIPLFLRDELGPSKKKKIFISFLSALWMCLVIILIAHIPGKMEEVQQKKADVIFEEPKTEMNKVAFLDKKRFVQASPGVRISLIKNALGNHYAGDYCSIRFNDGTGIQFPGADIHITGWYGEMAKDGTITTKYGQVLIQGDDTFDLTLYPKKDLLENFINSKISHKWDSDATRASVKKDGDVYDVSFYVPAMFDGHLTEMKTEFNSILDDNGCRKILDGASIGQSFINFFDDSEQIKDVERLR